MFLSYGLHVILIWLIVVGLLARMYLTEGRRIGALTQTVKPLTDLD